MAYDRQSPIGRLDKALDEALNRGWTVVDMKKDWKKYSPFNDIHDDINLLQFVIPGLTRNPLFPGFLLESIQ